MRSRCPFQNIPWIFGCSWVQIKPYNHLFVKENQQNDIRINMIFSLYMAICYTAKCAQKLNGEDMFLTE